MSKYLPRILIGAAAGFVAALVLTLVLGPGFGPIFYGAFIGVFVAYILSNLAGNRKVAAASGAEKAAALALTPPAGKALLVPYREGFVAKLAGLNLAVDGQEFVQLTAPKFTCLVAAPGAHSLTGAFGGLAGAQSKAAAFEFQAVEGGVTVVRINAQMGMVQGAVKFTPETDLAAVKAKLAGMPMATAAPAEV